jgi:hypothetical protein
MTVVLREDMFTNNKCVVSYGTHKEALFTIVDEEFYGNNHLGRLNLITCLVREIAPDGTTISGSFGLPVVGLGDGAVGVMSDVPELLGKPMTRTNMEHCVVELSE